MLWYVITQVDEMGKAVDVAERNTARFGLTQAEVANRRKWIIQTQREVISSLHTLYKHTHTTFTTFTTYLLHSTVDLQLTFGILRWSEWASL